ncbi:MAG: 2-amino-4-hydroxy-6-hydroxymethyldihydropteridine diphosphokinase [Candidatus Cloacimonetes bacterium]|jgi:2-amino-4-hydroxy-6-hydroxymethyldihydropteridine diphosphokinase|nr:2-amino-4-hydroxy-6-hydroxymethyldihydropteridine diphosphokinase [Candidatus Cloacimonadota bacterium]
MIYHLLLGSNLADRAKMIELAREHIAQIEGLEILRSSSVSETKAYGLEDQPDFLNCVLEVETELEPEVLLCKLLGIEHIMGRERTIKWGPRNIDIDILLAGDLVVQSPSLTLPHIDLHNRAFALKLLCELVPEALHPIENKTMAELLNRLDIGE